MHFNNKESQKGSVIMEYALVIAVIAIVVAATLATLGDEVKGVFAKATNCISNASSCNK